MKTSRIALVMAQSMLIRAPFTMNAVVATNPLANQGAKNGGGKRFKRNRRLQMKSGNFKAKF